MKISDFQNMVQSIFFVMMLMFFLTMLLCVSIFSESLVELKSSKMEQVKTLVYQKVLLEERFIFEEIMSLSERAIRKRFRRISDDLGLKNYTVNLLIDNVCHLGACGEIKSYEKNKEKLFRIDSVESFSIVYNVGEYIPAGGVLVFEIPQDNFKVSLSFMDQFILYLVPFSILLVTWFVWYFYIEKRVISPFISKLVTTAKERATMKVTKQVAHDIRSPLAALEIVMEDIRNLPEDSRELTLHAINRIQDIATNLSKESSTNDSIITECLPSISVANVINEKCIEYQNLNNIFINFIDETSRCEFVSILESDLSRTISNLVNNSVDSLKDRGQIDVRVKKVDNNFLIIVSDNGSGFSKDFIEKPIMRGNTVGKEHGQGLGLYHAKEVIEKAGGHLVLGNTPIGKGAEIKIYLPLSPAPKWFKSSIKLSDMDTTYIVDDDRSIHDVWKKLLNKKSNLVIKDLYTEKEIETSLGAACRNSLVLMDYDLRQDRNGIDYIKKFDLKNVALVTSNYDTEEVVEFCNSNNVQLIPKQIVSAIQIV